MIRILRSIFSKAPVDPDSLREERWKATLVSPKRGRFLEERESTHRAEYAEGALEIRFQRARTLAWAEDPLYRYADLTAEAEFRFPDDGGYYAAGLQFRKGDEGDYYQALVSTKGYFRLDAVFNGGPLLLVPWTELPPPRHSRKATRSWRAGNRVLRAALRIVALGDHITVIVDDAWAGEVLDATHREGKFAFAAASYDAEARGAVRMERFELDSRPVEVEAAHYRWNALIRTAPSARLALARSFEAVDQPLSALVQLKRAWKEEGERRPEELLLAARCARALALNREAEEYLDRCIEADLDSREAEEALVEKASLLYAENRYAELKAYAQEAAGQLPGNALLRVLLGHAFWNLGAWGRAADAYGEAWALDPSMPLAARNAAAALEEEGRPGEAARLYLDAGRRFLADEAYDDLGLVLARLEALAPKTEDPAATGRVVAALKGKRAFALGRWPEAEALLSALAAEGDADSAVHYLSGLLALRRSDITSALDALERARDLEPDYAPYRYKLAETRRAAGLDPKAELEAALALDGEDGWTRHLAALVALDEGRLDDAEEELAAAEGRLGDEPAIRAGRAELAADRGSIDEALTILGYPELPADREGTLAAEAASVLARAERWEEAEDAYRRAADGHPAPASLLVDRAACLVELGRLSEADEALARSLELAPSARAYALIAYVSGRRGEHARAEAACRVGLEELGENPELRAALADVYLAFRRWKAAEAEIDRLEALAGSERAEPFRARLLEATTRVVSCAGCGRTWRIPLEREPVGTLRLVAQPPDELPAGSCSECGKTWCIGCAKERLDEGGRFLCSCGGRLKLNDEGLKGILADWARSNAD